MAWWRRIFRVHLRKEKSGLPEHVELWIRELVDEGMEPHAAREEALRCFGLEKGSDEPAGYPPICMKLSRLP